MFGACTDDIMPNHLLINGHLDHLLMSLMRRGVDPVTVVQMATINVAQHYGFWGLGAVAPGWLADVVILDDLENISVRHVIVNGRIVVEDKGLATPVDEPVPPLSTNTVRIPKLTSDSFRLRTLSHNGSVTANAIDVSGRFPRLTTVEVACQDSRVTFPLPEGISLAAMVPRHGQGTPPSLTLISGYPLREGAIASTVSHDSHNLCVIGRNPEDMLAATQCLAELGGGLTAVKNGHVLASVPLPVAGLLSPLPVPEIADQVENLERSIVQLGLPKAFPSLPLGIGLPVVPEVRLTDRGLVDVATQAFLPLFP
jgi:adenine deaminase